MTQSDQSNWLEVQDPSSGYPDEIPLTLTEGELVTIQLALGESALATKLRAIQMEAFTKAHG